MNEYEFYIDRKVTIWERDNYTISADSRAEAFEKAKDLFFNADKQFKMEGDEEDGCVFDCTDTLYDTSEDMSLADNDGQMTQELIFADTCEQIANNLDGRVPNATTVKTEFLQGVEL